MIRKSLLVRIQKDAQTYSFEQINAKFDAAQMDYYISQKRWVDLLVSNAPAYIVDEAAYDMDVCLIDMDYWVKVEKAKKKMAKKVKIVVEIA